jgi:SAM-dependent methyltransferase
VRVPRDDHAIALGLPGGRSRWVVCEDCALVYQSPRPGADVVDDLYVGGSYHEGRGGVPEHYLEYSLRRSREAIAWGLSRPSLRGRTGRALDIGCGVGGALVELQRYGWDVIGVEPDPELAATGRDRFGLEIIDGFFDAEHVPPWSFDLAYSCHVWEHLADPVATSRVAHQVLAPNQGHLLIVVPTFRQARTLAWACFTSPHTYMFTDVSLGNLLDACGFDVIDHCYAASADSELWLLARARPSAGPTGAFTPERPEAVQRELALVPFRAPLGAPGRLRKHIQTFRADPRDFGSRLGRWTRAQLSRARRASSR